MKSFLDLPAEILIEIFSYLDLEDLFALTEICKLFNSIINDEELWKVLMYKKFHIRSFSSVSNSYKFSVEFFRRAEMLAKWKKTAGFHKFMTVNTLNYHQLEINYPRLLTFADDCDVQIYSIPKGKIDICIPVATPSSSSAFSFNSTVACTGSINGYIFFKLLQPKQYWSESKKVQVGEDRMVMCIDNDYDNCFSGDDKGEISVISLKNVINSDNEMDITKFKLGDAPLVKVKGFKNTVIAYDFEHIYVVNLGESLISKIKHSFENLHDIQFFEIDFGGEVVIIGTEDELRFFSYNKSSFGRLKKFVIGRNDSIFKICLEEKKKFSRVDHRVSGGDGCNMGILSKAGRVITLNTRSLRSRGTSDSTEEERSESVQELVEFVPEIDDLDVPLEYVSLCSIAINSLVVLVGSYNGYVSAFDVNTGNLVRQVSKKIPKRYLPAREANRSWLVPVDKIQLASNHNSSINDSDISGVFSCGTVVQYFQYGELSSYGRRGSSSRRGQASGAVGASGRRGKDRFKAAIKGDLSEIEYQDYESLQKDRLIEKYNGTDVTSDEELELAMVYNQSLLDAQGGGSGGSGLDADEELRLALELSRLEAEEPTEGTLEDLHPSRELPGSREPPEDADEELRLALEMSRLEAELPATTRDSVDAPATTRDSAEAPDTTRDPAEAPDDLEEREFQRQLQEALRQSLSS